MKASSVGARPRMAGAADDSTDGIQPVEPLGMMVDFALVVVASAATGVALCTFLKIYRAQHNVIILFKSASNHKRKLSYTVQTRDAK